MIASRAIASQFKTAFIAFDFGLCIQNAGFDILISLFEERGVILIRLPD
jgi:hypothetical protein